MTSQAGLPPRREPAWSATGTRRWGAVAERWAPDGPPDREHPPLRQTSAAPDRLSVEFTRIGSNEHVPDLVLPWMGVRELRDHIHAYVEDHLGPVVFSISLSGDGGFIDLGTHNAGLFRVRARHEPAPGRPHHG